MFEEYAVFSSLHLNLKKTVVIPLFSPTDMDAAKSRINDLLRQAPHVIISLAATYLGIILGPGAEQAGLGAPVEKFLKAADKWSKLSLGDLMDVRVYSIFAFFHPEVLCTIPSCHT